MADPVAQKSGFLKMYMSGHPDTLIAYAKWYGKVDGRITSAEMTLIDCNSMTLRCTMASSEKKDVVVHIVPPLKGYDDVKPRLLEMKAIAQEGLGMIQSPRITTFDPPRQLYTGFVLFSILLWGAYFAPSSIPLPIPTTLTSPYIPHAIPIHKTGFRIVFGIWTGGHSLEMLYTAHLCKKCTTFSVGLLYSISTVIAGYPIWVDLRRKIQKARIDSVMKVQ